MTDYRIYHADDLYKYNQQQGSANNKQESLADQMSPHDDQQISHQQSPISKSQQQISAAQFISQIPPLIHKQEEGSQHSLDASM